MGASHGIHIRGPMRPGYDTILTPQALGFLADLTAAVRPRLDELLALRVERQARYDAGERPGFLAETADVRAGDWTVAPLPADLQDRRVEITGPVDRKMVINALNSGASCFMADFEDSNAPTWDNTIRGQINLRDAVRRSITFTHPTSGKHYALKDETATLLVRPRGWHLEEHHLELDGRPLPASLVDFGLYFFHNAKELLARDTGPYFYLPKMESHLEAKLWDDVFVAAQQAVGIPVGTIKATVLIETLPAAFEMDEILHALQRHSSGLNCGRWDYIFSFIKKLRNDASRVMPDRSDVGMTQPCMAAYTQLCIQTCHRRGVHAMGGMAAQIPIKRDPEANQRALDKVRADKLREAKDGHDGTWVAHPGLVGLAKEIFDEHMPTANQIHRKRLDVDVDADKLLEMPSGTRTDAGLRLNVRVGVQYIEAWLRGNGCVPLYDLMEDAATAEISRAQVWQWLKHGAIVGDAQVTAQRLSDVLDDELGALRGVIGAETYDAGKFAEARDLFFRLSTAETFEEFLTVPAYQHLVTLTD